MARYEWAQSWQLYDKLRHRTIILSDEEVIVLERLGRALVRLGRARQQVITAEFVDEIFDNVADGIFARRDDEAAFFNRLLFFTPGEWAEWVEEQEALFNRSSGSRNDV